MSFRSWLLAGIVVVAPAVRAAGPDLAAEAPHEIVASGLHTPSGIVIAPSGSIFFTDEAKGLYRIDPGGSPVLLSNGVDHPGALLLQDGNRLLVVAKKFRNGSGNTSLRGLLLSFDVASTTFTVLADGFRHPRGLALDGEGGILVSADGFRPDADDGGDDDDVEEEDEDPPPFPGGIFRWTPGGGVQAVRRDFRRPAGLVVEPSGAILVAATRHGELRGSLFRVSASGSVALVYAERLKQPRGLSRDATGAVFLTGRRRGAGSQPGVIVKLAEGRPPVDFATGPDRAGILHAGWTGNALCL